jgi:methylenetetrahydrofolate reductase (NADPH)
VTRLLLPYEPDEVVGALAARKAADPGFGIEAVHLFPLGGIGACIDWIRDRGCAAAAPALPG